MPVHFVYIPAEGPPTVGHRGKLQNAIGVPERLLAVQVNDRAQIGEAMVRGDVPGLVKASW